MAHFSFRSFGRSTYRFPIRCGLASVVALSAMVPSTQAEPVTFRFDATIGFVFPGLPFDSGIDFAEGDIISGRFTFQPDDGNGGMFFEANQPYDFALNINGAALLAPSFEIEVFNNGHVADFPGASRIDSLQVGAGGLVPVDPSMLPNIDGTSGFRMELWVGTSFLPGEMDVLETAMIPGDAATWNRFNLQRVITVSLQDGIGGTIGFQATLGEIMVIPEPSTYCLVLFLLATFPIVRSRPFNHS